MDRANAGTALGAGHRRDVNIGAANVLTDPLVCNIATANARHAGLMQFIVIEAAIVGNDGQKGNAVACGGPEGGASHEEIAISEHCHSYPPAPSQRESRPDQHTWARSDSSTAVISQHRKRIVHRPVSARPR